MGTVRPRLTPIPVTMPIETRHSSLMSMNPMPAEAPPLSPNMPPDLPESAAGSVLVSLRIRSRRFSRDSRAMTSSPKVANSFRTMG